MRLVFVSINGINYYRNCLKQIYEALNLTLLIIFNRYYRLLASKFLLQLYEYAIITILQIKVSWPFVGIFL